MGLERFHSLDMVIVAGLLGAGSRMQPRTFRCRTRPYRTRRRLSNRRTSRRDTGKRWSSMAVEIGEGF
jgi:hypothetical protein